MKIQLNILPERRNFRFTLEKGWFLRHSGETDPGFELEAVLVSCELDQVQGAPILSGNLETWALMSCCRCLELARIPIKADFRYILASCFPEEPMREEMNAEDADIVVCPDDILDLEPVVYEQIILQLPMKPLCRQDCLGLCPRCGADLNREKCACGAQLRNPAFSVLKDFKIKKKL